MSALNQDQIDYWNGPAGERWAAMQALLDPMIEPFGRAALARADVLPGERVLDVGCGAGATTLELARAVGPAGSVLGVDVSGPMLAHARARLAEHAFVELRLDDAATARFEPTRDLVFSRFGVMFFRDPVAAFTNLRSSLAPFGRVVFVCWRAFEENAWARVPIQAIAPVVGPLERPAPDEPGPFSFGDPARVRSILTAAGLTSIAIEPFDTPYVFGPGLDAAADFALRVGPAARACAEASEATRERARAKIREALSRFAAGGDVRLAAATWIVSARAAR